MTSPQTSLARLPDWSSLSEFGRMAALEQCRRRMAHLGRMLHAVEHIYHAEALHQGPLSGLPYVAKDMFATGRSRPSWGCSSPQAPALPRASVIDRLDQAGASLIGTSTMTELAYEPSGMARRRALNPWRFDVIPGGSSTGSAILVAAGCCFAALGSDTAGSVRIPAHCCGITALKPGHGKIPLDGAMALAPSLDSFGMFARSAADLALLWPVISGDPAGADERLPRVALLRDAFEASEAELAAVCAGAVSALAEGGMTIEDVSGFSEEADRHALTVLLAEAAREHRARIDDPSVDATLRKRISKGLAITDGELATANSARDALRHRFITSCLGEGRIAVLPVMPIRTPRVNQTDPASGDFDPRVLYALSRFTRFVNYLGLPALAVPAGFDGDGMPVGLQLIGGAGSEAMLLQVAVRLQQRTDWHGRVPTAVASDIAGEP
ncbi:MAG TPA: amidase [Bradyrhizobium sp.]|uniref:amidase n=1 Tax=Bradyrhizobium sp. TaxID=376 RepID=UPI002D80A280|nr:amidase [Bradyrhizobium sp.]HET7886164.1 amidase [Bradyrhizobium sp.]